MRDQIRQFVIDSLREMNYDVDGIDDETMLGPAGVDLESLALAELAVRMEEGYGVKFDEDELEKVAAMTVGELTDHLLAGVAALAPVGAGGLETASASAKPAE
jgi:acyl carrier protein